MAKQHTKNSENGYIAIRRGIYEHLSDGRMTGKELMVYIILHLKADHRTGICYKVSAPMLAKLLQLEETARTVNRWLTSLEKKGYIKRLNHRGQVPFYPIIINKFLTSSCLLIDAHNPLLHKAVTDYLKGDLSFSCLLSVLSTRIIQEDKDNIPPTEKFVLSSLLFSEIQKRKPDFKKPNLQQWSVHIDRMIKIDNRKPPRIAEVIRWCQIDDFWQNNILSTDKLRKQFDKLELKMDKGKPTIEPLKRDAQGRTPGEVAQAKIAKERIQYATSELE